MTDAPTPDYSDADHEANRAREIPAVVLPPRFAPQNWAWLAADGRAYLSARQTVLAKTPAGRDKDLKAAIAEGRVTPWPADDHGGQTDAALLAVVSLWNLALSPPDESERLLAYVAALRFTFETGGLSVGGRRLLTDRASQAMISGAVALIQLDPAATIQFKSADGFARLDAAAVTAIALAVGRHVQEAFAREAAVAAAIDAGTITTTAQIDAAFAGGAA